MLFVALCMFVKHSNGCYGDVFTYIYFLHFSSSESSEASSSSSADVPSHWDQTAEGGGSYQVTKLVLMRNVHRLTSPPVVLYLWAELSEILVKVWKKLNFLSKACTAEWKHLATFVTACFFLKQHYRHYGFLVIEKWWSQLFWSIVKKK